jgi:2-oxoglutarate dehydrogenase E1 component
MQHDASSAPTDDFGSNTWLVEDMRERYERDPQSVSEHWRDYFARETHRPDAPVAAAKVPAEAAQEARPAEPEPEPELVVERVVDPNEEEQALRGAAAVIVDRMEESKDLPTATSVRTFPAKLLEVNRRILNNQLQRRGEGGKVSFTHLIGWAVVRALLDYPSMSASYREIDGKPHRVAFKNINLGLAMDMPKKGGGRTLLVPNIKSVDQMTFRGYWEEYEALVARVRSGAMSPDDFAGTTATLTNPGTVGTVQSVPRLMPGQGVIVGVGRIGFPPEYEGADPATIAAAGIGRTLTMTSTYDHRIIQGAESGMFLARVHALLLGADGFYDHIFTSMEVPYVPARWAVDTNPPPGSQAWAEKQAQILQLINMYRVRGHLIADLDPLRQDPPAIHPELDPLTYGLSMWDLEREFATGGFGGRPRMTLVEILGMLRDAYCRTSGIEYMHIQEPDQKLWIQQHGETRQVEMSKQERFRILEKLNAAEAFERFLHTKFLGAKRFSLEGAESIIPLLDALLNTAANFGIEEVALGMAHRGRLNVLANVVQKPLAAIFREFVGHDEPETDPSFSGDVKYHLGAKGIHETPDGREIAVEVAANPSHLEAIDPVLVGITRAKQDARGAGADDMVLPLLIHGDAAFSGQGVVAETLNLSQLDGYYTGGTVHVVINNQVGFTTAAHDARSSFYATDVAKAVQAPIFHVNGDDPEAVVRVAKMAFSFRDTFRKDVVIDLVCYRRLGHNEGDEPSYTQPRMYRLIQERPSVRELYAERLVKSGQCAQDEIDEMHSEYRARLDAAYAESSDRIPQIHEPHGPSSTPIITRVAAERLDAVKERLQALPQGFETHPKMGKVLDERRKLYTEGNVDWAMAEALAFGTLAMEGTPIRLAGEDSQRGTFSHRHAVLVDFQTEQEYTPLANVHPNQAPIRIYDSLLSEFAAMGFEYGYSVASPETLVLWEAQFGDFVNGAQVIIDQFLSSGMDKWDQTSGLVLLLPHGFEGQGPEHSSARMERFLQNAAEDNMRIVVPSTPAQYFHMLRLQAHHPEKRPLVVMTPKSLLRSRQSFSAIADLSESDFHPVIKDDVVAEGSRRVILCAGKVYYDLAKHREANGIDDIALIRIELLYPFPADELKEALEPHPDAEVVWVQEEPANMGAWRFMSRYLFVEAGFSSRGIYRKESASPATGNPRAHMREQQHLVEMAFE